MLLSTAVALAAAALNHLRPAFVGADAEER